MVRQLLAVSRCHLYRRASIANINPGETPRPGRSRCSRFIIRVAAYLMERHHRRSAWEGRVSRPILALLSPRAQLAPDHRRALAPGGVADIEIQRLV